MAYQTTTQIDFHNKAYAAGAAIKFGSDDQEHLTALLECGAVIETGAIKADIDPDDLAAMSVKALAAIAAAEEVVVTGKEAKADLVALIEAKRTAVSA